MKTWHEFMKNRIEGGEKNIPWFLLDKIKLNDFAIKNNISVPKIYNLFNNPDKITLSHIDIGSDVVLKPTKESSTRGVMVLHKKSDGFYDSLSRKLYSLEEIIQYQKNYFDKNMSKENKIILEEKVYDIEEEYIIPRDFKFYMFDGEIALILVIDRNRKPGISLWYDSKFNPITDDRVKCNAPFSRTLSYYTKPLNSEKMIEFATNISKLIKTPFASIDIYNSSRGPLLGEVTLTPGGIYHGKHYTLSDAQERLMGYMWFHAELRNKL